MAIGTVKWFNNAKGYGFILPDGGGDDLFAHYSAIQMDGYKTLKAGQPVEFEITEGPKGLQATNIQSVADGVSVDEYGEADEVGTDEVAANGASATSEVVSVTVEEPAPPQSVSSDGHSGLKAGRSS
jgi:CspA family cold shock protein